MAQSDFIAWNRLGLMHDEGDSISQDYTEAAKWARKAAEQGDADAQFTLGWHYSTGQGVPQDFVEAHKWYNLAAAQGHETARKNKDLVEKRMTPEDISRAQELAQTWTPSDTDG